MNFGNIVQDPHFSMIIFEIEKIILACDIEAKSDGLNLKDFDIKSALQKALGMAKGKSPSIPEKSKKERALAKLTRALANLGSELVKSESGELVTANEWMLSLKAVDDSLKTRRKMYGHSRGYLDFLKGFLEDGKLI